MHIRLGGPEKGLGEERGGFKEVLNGTKSINPPHPLMSGAKGNGK